MGSGQREHEGDPSSTIICRALGGDAPSLEWVTDHFYPFVLKHAGYLTRRHLGGSVEPEELAHQVWAIFLAKVQRGFVLQRKNGRFTEGLLGYLNGITQRRTQELIGAVVRRSLAPPPRGRGASSGDLGLDILSSPASDAPRKVGRSERMRHVLDALDRLPRQQQDIVLFRAVEGLPYKEISRRLDLDANRASTLYSRALQELRACLPGDLLGEMSDE